MDTFCCPSNVCPAIVLEVSNLVADEALPVHVPAVVAVAALPVHEPAVVAVAALPIKPPGAVTVPVTNRLPLTSNIACGVRVLIPT